MSMEKMQDEFEQAIAEEAVQSLTAIQLSRKGDSYSTSPLIYAWWAWQESRQRLQAGSGQMIGWTDNARLAAGLKVKP